MESTDPEVHSIESEGCTDCQASPDNEMPELNVSNEPVAGRLVDLPLWKAMLILALPVFAEQFLTMLVGLVDIYLTGQFLTSDHLAAIGIMSYLLWTIPSVFGAISIGTLALVSRNIGAGEVQNARLVTNQALLLGIVTSVILTVVCWTQADSITSWLQLRDPALSYAREYFRWVIPVIPFIMCQQVGVAALRGAGDTLSGSIVLIVVNAINMFVSYGLVTGTLGFPKYGWSGVAIGTMIGYLIGGSLTVGLLLAGRRGLRLSIREMQPNLQWQKKLIRIGLPGGADMISLVGCQLWFLGIINTLGTVAGAAHALAIRVESLAYLPCNAFQATTSTLVGQYLGANQPKKAKSTTLIILAIAFTAMLFASAVFMTFSEFLVGLFLSESNGETLKLASSLLFVIAWGLPSLAIVNVFYGALRGAGETRGPLFVTLFSFLVIRIPLTLYLALEQWPTVLQPVLGTMLEPVGLGVLGAWYAMVTDLVIRCLLTTLRFLFGPWQKMRL